MANESPPPNSGSPPPSGSSSSSPPSSPPPSPPAPSENNNENSSPSPPPPSEGSSSSSPPPPTPTEGSSQTPSPPTEGGNESNKPPPVEVVPSAPGTPPQNPAPPAPFVPPNQPSPSSGSGSSYVKSLTHNRAGVITGVVVGGGIVLLLVCMCILFLRKKKKRGDNSPPYGYGYGWDGASKPQGNQYWQTQPQDHAVKIPSGYGVGSGDQTGGQQQTGQNTTSSSSLAPSSSLTLGFNKSTFTYDMLSTATNGFDKSRMLGQGGFGYVHKGVLPSGQEIAVKSLKSGSGQGEREFQSEVEIISRVHHRHLVSLVGYCIAGGQRMLVYEFVPNDTLEFHLHKRGQLDFPTRLRIALGSAKGLGYLHEDCHPRIIHRDIKASNILLDENYEAMVADFGLAKLTTDTNTHVSTRVMGTFGYLAPEYASSGKLTEKSDVFSFGVMLLEIITGRRPVDPNMNYMEDSLVDWCRPLLSKALEGGNNYHEFVDPRLEGNYDPSLMKRLVACAAASIRHSAKKRPKMSQIVRALEGDVSLDDLNQEVAKSGQGSMPSSDGSEYDTRAYSADLKKFRQMALETRDFASSEYGASTNEYALNQSTTSSDSSRDISSRKMA